MVLRFLTHQHTSEMARLQLDHLAVGGLNAGVRIMNALVYRLRVKAEDTFERFRFERDSAVAWRLAYHSRYTLRSGQPVLVFRCRQCRKTFCDRFGTASYDLKTPEEKVQRAIQQGLEGLCPEAVARVEGVHPTTIQRSR
jgi:hypothetical protein